MSSEAEDSDGGRPEQVEVPEAYRELYQTWCEELRETEERASTIDKREKGVRYWLAFVDEYLDCHPFDADGDDLESYIDYIGGAGDNTISTRVSTISVFYEWLGRTVKVDADIEENPRSSIDLEEDFGIKQNRSDSKVARVLSREDRENLIVLGDDVIDKMIEHAPNPTDRNALIISMLADTGVRADELCRMKLRNIDWENRRIRIRSSKLDDDHDLIKRYVFYTERTEEMLEEWVNKGRYRVSPSATDSPYIFLTDQSQQMRPSFASRKVKEAANNAGVNEVVYVDGNGNNRHLITAHRLRHTAISRWVNDMPEIGLEDARRMAGHAKLETTQSYTHTDWDGVQRSFRAAHSER